MRGLIVYESMFGNTEFVARAIGEGLAEHMPVDLAEVGEAAVRIPDDVTILVAGGPTHAFGMSRPGTRRSAADQAETPLVSQGRGIREWLEELEPPGHECSAVAFDTKGYRPRLPGGAARGIAKRLRRKGFRPLGSATTFWVQGTAGPLADGEIRRAREWGMRLAIMAGAPERRGRL